MINNYKNTIFDLSEKAGVVTGGGRGLGRAMAIGLAKAGASIVIADINPHDGISVSNEIKKFGGRALFIETDVSKKKEVEKMVEETVKNFGSLDIAINNAGVTGKYLKALAESETTEKLEAQNIEEADVRKQIDVMLIGVLLCCQEEAKQMIKQKKGRIINIASMSASIVNKGQPGMAVYCAIKAGVKHMTKALAVDWVKYNITVNSISPGNMLTPPGKPVLEIPKLKKMILDICPMNRLGDPDELVGAAILLSSDASSFITGHDLIIDGGTTVW